MTPNRREELRRAEDALMSARYNLDRKAYIATIAAQEDRIKSLESLLAELGCVIQDANHFIEAEFGHTHQSCDEAIIKIDAILPATEERYIQKISI